MEPDFSGWATKAGLRCTDGRTIMPEAFKHMDGKTVPLVWQHAHDEPSNVLGHAVLEALPEGVYARAYFNDTEPARQAKALVQHRDIVALSIYANKLVEKSKQVFHGMIREVSLVLSGANPGAVIDNVAIAHGDDYTETLEDEAVIYTGLELEHSDKSEDASDDKSEETSDDKSDDESDDKVEHAEDDSLQEIIDSMSDEQRDVLFYMVGEALNKTVAQSDKPDNDMQQSDVSETDAQNDDISHQEGNTMTRNVFEQDATKDDSPTLSHSQIKSIIETAKKSGSLKEAVLQHAVEYGIENIDTLFPDAKTITNTPELVARRMEWVNVVLNGIRKSPFSRIKTVAADLTLDQARAKGYVKGNLKKEEWFTLTKRITTPTTIYKKQKLDRDDIIDITDLDVVAFLKGEMRVMLDEEIARAILVGDGRQVDDEDKVNDQNIRPIAHDNDFFSHRVVLPANTNGEGLVESILRARPKYRGSGNPTLFCTEDLLTDLLLGKDKMGRRLYNNQEDLRVALRVRDIITVDVMEDQSTDGGDLMALIVNLSDYTAGADRGGNVAMFDDFDIDYNQYKYLIETRMSGALTKFKSALVFVRSAGTMVTPEVPGFDPATGVVTIPSTAGVIYTNAATNAVLPAGDQPPLAAGETVEIAAEPATGYYFPANVTTTWSFTRNV